MRTFLQPPILLSFTLRFGSFYFYEIKSKLINTINTVSIRLPMQRLSVFLLSFAKSRRAISELSLRAVQFDERKRNAKQNEEKT